MQSSTNSTSAIISNNYYSLMIKKQQKQQQKLANQNSSSTSSSPIPPLIHPCNSTIDRKLSTFQSTNSIVDQTSDRSSSTTSVAQIIGCTTTLSNLSLSNLNKHLTNVDSQQSSRESLHSVGNFRTSSLLNKKNNNSSSRPGIKCILKFFFNLIF